MYRFCSRGLVTLNSYSTVLNMSATSSATSCAAKASCTSVSLATSRSYDICMRKIHEFLNRSLPPSCLVDGVIDTVKIRKLCRQSCSSLDQMCNAFQSCLLLMRMHTTGRLRHVGSLKMYAAAFTYFVWRKDTQTVPPRWLSNMCTFFAGLQRL